LAQSTRPHSSFIYQYQRWLSSAKVRLAVAVALLVAIPGERGLAQILGTRPVRHFSEVSIEYTYLSNLDMASRYALCCQGLFSEYSRLLMSQGGYLHSPSDFLGNVKIPDFASLKSYQENDEEWTIIPWDDTVTYSSLSGIPIAGVPSLGVTTFTFETSYYAVQCDNVTMGPPREYYIIGRGDAYSESPAFSGPFSETNITFGLDSTASLSLATAGFERSRWPDHWNISENLKERGKPEPQPLLVQSTRYGSSIKYVREHNDTSWSRNTTLSAFCTVQMHYLSVNVSCAGSSCAATSMRPSQMPHPNMNLTDFGNIRAFFEFTSSLMIAGRDGHANTEGDLIDGNTLTEYFLQDPYFGSKRDRWGSYGPFYEHPLSTPEEFAVRLQMVLNGFKMLLMGGTVVREHPNLSNTKFTTGEHIVEGIVPVVDMWRLSGLLLTAVGLIMIGTEELLMRVWYN
jgi:hypothetical protein